MPLPPAAEFLALQRVGGRALSYFVASYIEVAIPALATVRWNVTPPEGVYAHYGFRVMIDDSVVPWVFSATVRQYGVVPYTATISGNARGMHIDYMLRVLESQPIINEVTNLTPLTQRWVSANQGLNVVSEDDFFELEERLRMYYNQVEGG